MHETREGLKGRVVKLLRGIRYSAVGVFFSGIVMVLQGCSIEREGALFAALLLLLSFCSGPAANMDGNGGPAGAVIFDNFTATTQQVLDACETNAGVDVGVDIPNQGTHPVIERRGIRNDHGSVADTEVNISIGGGFITYENTGTATCNSAATSMYWGFAPGNTQGNASTGDYSAIFPANDLAFEVTEFAGTFGVVLLSIIDGDGDFQNLILLNGTGSFVIDFNAVPVLGGGNGSMDGYTNAVLRFQVTNPSAGARVVLGPMTLQ